MWVVPSQLQVSGPFWSLALEGPSNLAFCFTTSRTEVVKQNADSQSTETHPELVRQVISVNASTDGSPQSRYCDLEITILQILRKEL